MSVHKLKDGRWIVRYVRGTIPADPTRTREYFGRGFEAEKKARQRNNELSSRSWQRRTPGAHSPAFVDLVNAYAKAKVGKVEKSTLQNFLVKMRAVILPELGSTPAARITRRRLDQYTAKRLKTLRMTTGKKPKPIFRPNGSPAMITRSTVHRELSDIQAVLNWSVSEKYLVENPAGGHKKPKRDDEIITPPTSDEIRRLVDVAPDHLQRALIFSYFTGTRPGASELLSIKWADVDLERKIVFIRSAKKNGVPARSVPMHKALVDSLTAWKKTDQDDDRRPEYVIHFRGRQIKRIIKSFNAAKTKAGITRRLRPYDFRHAFATAALSAGGDLKATSELLGHTRTETTARIYQHVDSELKRNVIDRLPDLIDNNSKLLPESNGRKS